MHRDLKPENLLLDDNFNIKVRYGARTDDAFVSLLSRLPFPHVTSAFAFLHPWVRHVMHVHVACMHAYALRMHPFSLVQVADFGLAGAFQSKGELMYTNCGTPVYMAPGRHRHAYACMCMRFGSACASSVRFCMKQANQNQDIGKPTEGCTKKTKKHRNHLFVFSFSVTSRLVLVHACMRMRFRCVHACVSGGVRGMHACVPEMFVKGAGYDATASDVWAMGVILFVMLAGFPPFQAPSDSDWYGASCVCACVRACKRHVHPSRACVRACVRGAHALRVRVWLTACERACVCD